MSFSLPLLEWQGIVIQLLKIATGLALVLAVAVSGQRLAIAQIARRRRDVETRYLRVVRRALAGEQDAAQALVRSPVRHRLDLAYLLMQPLINDRDPVLVARTRAIVAHLNVVAIADQYLRSYWWWHRAIGARALGLIQMTDRTPQIVALLDDADADVRGAALDALRDLGSLDALNAIVSRLDDASLHPGRRAAALEAFGTECEPLVLELGRRHETGRAIYARALALCGTSRSRAALVEWTRDACPMVRAAAFDALTRVGLDEAAARRAIECLEHPEPRVRAMAAQSLRGWPGSAFTATQLARHLDDVWPVAVKAAHSLKAMRPDGLDALRRRAAHDGAAGTLARQMLWEEQLSV